MSLTDYKEKIEIYTKYLEKKSNLVGGKYLRLHRWISQVELSILQVWTLTLQVEFVISQLGDDLQLDSQLGGDFATWFAAAKMEFQLAKWHTCAWRWFRSCETPCEISQVDFISQLIS